MKKILVGLRRGWRQMLSVLFVLIIFIMPTTKGIMAHLFDSNVEAGGGHNQNHPSSRSQTTRSISCPVSNDTASPMQNSRSTGTGSAGTGHSHSRDHHNRHPRHK